MDPERENEQDQDQSEVQVSIKNLEDILNADQNENENENEHVQEHDHDSPQEFPATTDQPMAKTKNDNLLLDIVPKKKIKEQKPKVSPVDEDEEKPRRPSVTFNLNYKYTASESPTKKKSVISYIEESFKLTEKRQKQRGLPPIPKKQLTIALCLLVVGVICLLTGIILAVDNGSGVGIALLVIGALVGIPGAFYALKFCRVCYATTAESRVRALEEIPQD